MQKFGGANDGADLGGNTDSQADNANAMLQFSGRGPCEDGRQKPDLVAPAIHVSGGVIQAAKRGPDGTADSCFTEQSKFVIAVDGGPNGAIFSRGSTVLHRVVGNEPFHALRFGRLRARSPIFYQQRLDAAESRNVQGLSDEQRPLHERAGRK